MSYFWKNWIQSWDYIMDYYYYYLKNIDIITLIMVLNYSYISLIYTSRKL